MKKGVPPVSVVNSAAAPLCIKNTQQEGAGAAADGPACKDINKSILIFDESRFSRICQAILTTDGFDARTEADDAALCRMLAGDRSSLGLIITSYPFGSRILEHIKGLEIPIIILSDQINGELLKLLEGLKNSFCLLKPLDYQKFKNLVKQFVLRPQATPEGFRLM